MVFVCIIHNNFTVEGIAEGVANGGQDILFNNGAIGTFIQRFIEDGIVHCAVPLFFLFASYIQFRKKDDYKILLKKRAKSLVLPFFLWPFLIIAVLTLLKIAVQAVFPSLIHNPNKFIFSEWTAIDWVKNIFGYNELVNESGRWGECFIVPFWFIRDLFILIVLSPVLKYLVKKFPVSVLFAVSFFYLFGITPLLPGAQALFYYVLGIYWAESDFDLFSFCDRIKWRALLPLYFAGYTAYMFLDVKFSCMYWFFVFMSCFIVLKFSSILVKRQKLFSLTKYLAGYSFWLYAVHLPVIMSFVQTLWLKLFPMKNTFFCLFEFAGVTVFVILLGTFSGIIFKKICPKGFALLTGGR